MPVKYPEGSVSPSGKYVVSGGQWVPRESENIPEEVQTPQEPEGSSFERFVSGLWETTGKPITEIIPQLVKNAPELMPGVKLERDEETGAISPALTAGAQMGVDVLKGAYGAHKEQLLKALDGDSGMSERAGHLLAGLVPLVGPAAATAGERMAEGDVAGGLGEATGLAVPFLRPFQGIAKGGRTLARTSASKNVARALKAPAGLARRITERAEPISNELRVGSLEKLSKRAIDAEEKALAELNRVKKASADRIIPTKRIERAKQEVLDKADLIEGPDLTAKEIIGEGKGAEGWVAKANKEAAERRASLGRKPKPKPEETVPESFYESEANAAKKLADKLDRLAAVYEKQTGVSGVPAEQLFKAKSQMGRAASDAGAYSKLAGSPVSPGGRSAKVGQGALAKELKEAVPGLAEADMNYSDMRLAGELLENAASKGKVAGAPVFEVLGGRAGLGALLGGATGGLTGTPMGAIAGAGLGYGGFALAREILNSTFWNSLSARSKFMLAKQLGQGGLAAGVAGGSAAGRALEEEEQ